MPRSDRRADHERDECDQKRPLVDMVAEDDVGGAFVSLNGGGSGAPDDPALGGVLHFRPPGPPLRNVSGPSFVSARATWWWTLPFREPLRRES